MQEDCSRLDDQSQWPKIALAWTLGKGEIVYLDLPILFLSGFAMVSVRMSSMEPKTEIHLKVQLLTASWLGLWTEAACSNSRNQKPLREQTLIVGAHPPSSIIGGSCHSTCCSNCSTASEMPLKQHLVLKELLCTMWGH